MCRDGLELRSARGPAAWPAHSLSSVGKGSVGRSSVGRTASTPRECERTCRRAYTRSHTNAEGCEWHSMSALPDAYRHVYTWIVHSTVPLQGAVSSVPYCTGQYHSKAPYPPYRTAHPYRDPSVAQWRIPKALPHCCAQCQYLHLAPLLTFSLLHAAAGSRCKTQYAPWARIGQGVYK